MAEKSPEDSPENFWRRMRNINTLAAVTLAAAGVFIPRYQDVLFAGAGLGAAAAIGSEVIRNSKANQQNSQTA